eukprot:TRINITY_DN2341_c1_g3_i1.p1 TRINITY_DN2341_c1_g3~~TRINITY_DN2341_c1_g3_i1.p1  ORF type:complete len:1421 (+),score=444.41 TRINITY_DN2341_c1_g3_i1:34-4296(+)
MSGEEKGKAPPDAASGKITYIDGFPMKVDEGVARMADANAAGSASLGVRGNMRRKGSGLQDVVSRVRSGSGSNSKPPLVSPVSGLDSLFCDPQELMSPAQPSPLEASLNFPTPSQADNTRHSRARLVRLFRHYDQSRLTAVDSLLEDNFGTEEQLLQQLISQYGIEPPVTPSPYEERLRRYFRCYHLPETQLSVQLEDYAGKEEELLSMLVGMHGPEPVVNDTPKQPAPLDSTQQRRLTRFYEKYNPSKVPMVDDMLRSFSEHPCGTQSLFDKLVEKYGPEPAEDEVIRPRSVSRMNTRDRAGSAKVGRSPAVESPFSWRASLPAPTSSFVALDHSPLKKRLTRFYMLYNPGKVEEVDKFLNVYKGKEALLFQKLVAKYGPEPEDTDKAMKVDEDTRGDYFACLASSSPRKSLIRLGSVSSPEIRSSASPKRPKRVKVKVIDDAAQVKAMIESNPKLPQWDADYEKWVGMTGHMIKERKEDNIVGLMFGDRRGAWFPKGSIVILEERRGSVGGEQKRDSLASLGSLTSPDTKTNGSFSLLHSENGSLASLSPKGSFVKPSSHTDPCEEKAASVKSEGEDTKSEEEEEEEEEVVQKYVIRSTDYASEYSGQYVLQEETANEHPVWKREGKEEEEEAWLFSTPDGIWRVTDSKDDFKTGDGYFNTQAHEGRLPHRSGDWLNGDDEVDRNISVTPHDEAAGDRVMGGHVVVGRVCAELTEEELQYASFQRRRKFKPKKEVPISNKCSACRKFEAVCSKCYMAYRKTQKERREYLRDKYSSWDLRRKVGVFFSAVVEGEDDDVKVMIEAGANVNWLAFFKKRANEMNNLPEGGCGITPLHVACAYAQPDVACTLIGAGARYRRDQNSMLPMDYLPDNEDVAHDITMFLEERSNEYNISQQVQEAWDIYEDGDYKEASEAFFALLMQYPNRDTCHLGLLYCHLALGDIAACLQAGRESLNAKDVEWIECQVAAVQKAMDTATELFHERSHAEETEGCIKRCGCVVYPPEWTVPLKKMRKLEFGVMKKIFEWLPCSSAFNTWLALHRSELLRTAVDRHVTQASRKDPIDAVNVFMRVPAWLASFKEAVVEQTFNVWDAKQGDLAHVAVENIECDHIQTFPYFMLKVNVIEKYVAQTAISKLKGWWGDKGKKRSVSRSNPHSCDSFTVKLPSPDAEMGFNIHVQGSGINQGKIRLLGTTLGSPACKAGLLPGTILTVDGKEAESLPSFQMAIDEFRAAKKTELTIGVHVEVHEGSWVEAAHLKKMNHLNGVRGYVTGVAVSNGKDRESVLTVNFKEHGLVRLKPSNLVFFFGQEGREEDDHDAASVGSPSMAHSRVRSSSPSAFGGTVKSAVSTPFSDVSNHSFPVPVPPKRSRNEIYDKFKREKARFSTKSESQIYSAHLVINDPAIVYNQSWSEWRLKLQHTPSL